MYGKSSLLLNAPFYTISNLWLAIMVIGFILWGIVIFLEYRKPSEE